MLPQALLDLIEENLKQLYDEITLSDIIYRLHACKVLSEGEVDFLNECKGKQKKNYEFIRILKTREERDFKEFCDALIDHDAEAIQNLGKKLKSNLQTTTKSGHTSKQNGENESDFGSAIFTISKMIGTDWTKLATFLDYDMDTNTIKYQNPYNVFEQSKAALKSWSQKYPSKATVANLKKGLKEINRNDIISAL